MKSAAAPDAGRANKHRSETQTDFIGPDAGLRIDERSEGFVQRKRRTSASLDCQRMRRQRDFIQAPDLATKLRRRVIEELLDVNTVGVVRPHVPSREILVCKRG